MAQEVEEREAMKCVVFGFVASIIVMKSTALLACPQCRPSVEAGVYNQQFTANLFVLVLPVAVLFAMGAGLHYSDVIMSMLRKHRETQQ